MAAEYVPAPGWKILFPVYFSNTRYRLQAGDKKSDRWAHKLWIWPEVTYAISPNTSVGLAYYSDNLLKDDLSASSFDVGFESGVTQVLLQATL